MEASQPMRNRVRVVFSRWCHVLLYEMKFDGYRAITSKAGAEARLISRNRTLFNDDHPKLAEALESPWRLSILEVRTSRLFDLDCGLDLIP